MRGTGRKALLLSAIFGLLITADLRAATQEVSVRATLSENRVFIGEQFTLQIEIRGDRLADIGLPQLPGLDGLRLVNTTPSRSQSISVVNGRASTVTTYGYSLIGGEEGTFRIPPVRLTVDGEEMSTAPLQVEVVRHRSTGSPGDRRPDIFAEIEVDNPEPVVGQQLVASLVIYFREGVEVNSYQPAGGWRTDGFWKEQLENIHQPSTESVIFGGVRYRKATLLRYALFASRPGELVLSPYELHLGIRSRPRRNDPFGSVWGGLGTNQRRVTLETEELRLPVRRLDPPDRGISISAVGDLDLTRTASVRQSYVGEPIELTTTISGTGNLPLVSRPSYSLPESFEIYSPQEEIDVNRRGTTVRGTRIFRDRFVPRVAGTYTLPREEIAVFDPSSGSYRYRILPEITFEIIRDPALAAASTGEEFDLQLLTGLAVWQQPGRPLTEHRWIWAGFLLPLLLTALAWRRKRLLLRLESDHDFARSHHAWDRVEELLIDAEKRSAGEKPGEAYHLLHKAVTGYISDRTALPRAGLSDGELCEEVHKRTLDEDLARKLKKLLGICSGISYAPISEQNGVAKDIDRTRDLLRELRERL